MRKEDTATETKCEGILLLEVFFVYTQHVRYSVGLGLDSNKILVAYDNNYECALQNAHTPSIFNFSFNS